MIRPVHVDVPAQLTVVGELYASDNDAELSEDMLEVHAPGNVLIAAGWFANDCDEGGAYQITVSSGLHYIEPPIETRSVHDAATIVELLARCYAQQAQMHSDLSFSNKATSDATSVREIASASDSGTMTVVANVNLRGLLTMAITERARTPLYPRYTLMPDKDNTRTVQREIREAMTDIYATSPASAKVLVTG